ncbi:YdgA family protein [Colwellia sp. KU-HH00111]|uniref:DUF945 family protein n=1 Tax=Colwellia sp. KU-HH00111 TaxID=3127652 RepID=UPI003105F184
MKRILFTVIIIVAAGLIAPKFIGSIVKTEYSSAFDKLNANPNIIVNSTQYTHHWFEGKSVTEMTINIGSPDVDDITFTVEENLLFGPVILTEQGIKFALSYSQANINFKSLDVDQEIATFINDKLHLSSLITFTKDIVTAIEIDEISKTIDGNKLVSAKAIANFTIEDSKRVVGRFNWAGLSTTTQDKSFSLSGVEFSLDQTLIAGDYYQGNAISTGDFDFTIASLNMEDSAGNAVITLENVFINAVSAVTNKLMKAEVTYHVDKMLSAGQQLENANVAIVLDRFNINVLQEINTLMATLPPESEAIFAPENQTKIAVLIEKLLVDDPILKIQDLSVQTPEGKIESKMQVSIDKKRFDAANMMSIMPAVQASADGRAPKPFFSKLGLAPMIDMYVEQGFIVQNAQDLSVKLNFAQGQLNLNGNVLAL